MGSRPCARRHAKRRNERAPLRQLGDQLLKLGLGPGPGGAGSYIAQCAEREREFGDIVAIGCIDDDEEIVLARGQVDLLHLDSHFLSKLARGTAALGSVLDRADALVGPIQRQDERWHAVLLWLREMGALRCGSGGARYGLW